MNAKNLAIAGIWRQRSAESLKAGQQIMKRVKVESGNVYQGLIVRAKDEHKRRHARSVQRCSWDSAIPTPLSFKSKSAFKELGAVLPLTLDEH